MHSKVDMIELVAMTNDYNLSEKKSKELLKCGLPRNITE